MRDILFAVIGLALFALFSGVIISFVPEPDLVIVVLIVLAMVGWDFIRELFLGKKS